MTQIIISNIGDSTISLIKLIREYTGASLVDAKKVTDYIQGGKALALTRIPKGEIKTILADLSQQGIDAFESDDFVTDLELDYFTGKIQVSSSDTRKEKEKLQIQSSIDYNPVSYTPYTYDIAGSQASIPELNRDALKIYLHDVLALECIKNKYEKIFQEIDAVLESSSDIVRRYRIGIFQRGSSDRVLYLRYNGNSYFIATESPNSTYAGKVITHSADFLNPRWLNIESNKGFIQSHAAWRKYGIGFLDNRRYVNNAISEFTRVYSQFKGDAPDEFEKESQRRIVLSTKRNGILNELSDVQNLLQKTYALNIIPFQFRNNLYAVFYLYNFISSSNLPLSSALLHFDLQEIKTKLDEVIQQQQEIIIQQSLIMAQNQELISQNQACLQRLSSLEKTAANIEYNTSEAATYSAIAARNTEVCAWIGLANYLKD